MAKIGILGGTFDPIHNGHLALGKQAYEQFGLDEIWFMLSGHPPHKKGRLVTEGKEREDMVKLAIASVPYFVYSDFELKREGNTYTAQTLTLLKEAYPQHEFYFIIGADSLYEIEQWYHPELVMKQAVLLAAARTYEKDHRDFEKQINYLQEKYGARIGMIQFKEMDISSRQIRKAVGSGQSVEKLVPGSVAGYIRIHGLYREAFDDMQMSNHCSQIMMLRSKLKTKLDPMRYEHSLSVSFTCMNLAMRYGYDIDKAELAGLMHDCGKRFTDEIILKKCISHKILVTDAEQKALPVLHAKYGAWLAENKYGIEDPEIISAIACHTTGKADMSVLDKIVYIADYIEPRRYKADNLPQMRKLAYEDLDKTMYEILKSTLEYLAKKGAAADPMTATAYEYFRQLVAAEK